MVRASYYRAHRRQQAERQVSGALCKAESAPISKPEPNHKEENSICRP